MRKFIAATIIALVAVSAGAWASVGWEQDYDTALTKAKKEGKLVMVDVYTDWCGWCKKLDKDTYSNKDVETKVTKEFIALKINPEKGAQNKKLAKQLGTRGYPHIVFLDAQGKKLAEIAGYVPAKEFLDRLNQVTAHAQKK
ncbi:MAG TPA: thioredoxin fold domain-containing protein [Verrucomicrobiae bacterium]|nr:thioredoxin fold domain-containing protein [Verrucomicrobiae bacterium]